MSLAENVTDTMYDHARAILLKLISTIALRQLRTVVELLLQPGKVPHKRGPVANMRLPEAWIQGPVQHQSPYAGGKYRTFDLRRVLHSLHIRHRRPRNDNVVLYNPAVHLTVSNSPKHPVVVCGPVREEERTFPMACAMARLDLSPKTTCYGCQKTNSSSKVQVSVVDIAPK